MFWAPQGFGSDPTLVTPTPQETPRGFVLIQSGTFVMGSPPGELGRDDDET